MNCLYNWIWCYMIVKVLSLNYLWLCFSLSRLNFWCSRIRYLNLSRKLDRRLHYWWRTQNFYIGLLNMYNWLINYNLNWLINYNLNWLINYNLIWLISYNLNWLFYNIQISSPNRIIMITRYNNIRSWKTSLFF
jgi:hypothetical protein